MNRLTTAAALAAVAVPALALSACGGSVSIGTKTLDNENLERTLGTQLADSAGVDPADVKVACPGDQEVKKGRKFSCTLTTPNGDKVKVFVTLTNDEGGFTGTVPANE